MVYKEIGITHGNLINLLNPIFQRLDKAFFIYGIKEKNIHVDLYLNTDEEMNCPCCSKKLYEECCKPYHEGKQFAPSAEALMRSRFSAFAIPNGKYLMETTAPTKRQFHSTKDLQKWGEMNKWNSLEIVNKPSVNKVEFKAHYTDEDGQKQIHHELSQFKLIQNRWYYVSGEFLD